MRAILLIHRPSVLTGRRMNRVPWFCVSLFFLTLLATGCAHYPVNPPLKQVDPASGYRGQSMGPAGNSENLLLYLTFSGGGTRAVAWPTE